MRFLVAVPVYNEARHVEKVLAEVRRYADNVLVVNDGSSDGTAALLAGRTDVAVITHAKNRGYGAALISAFSHALAEGYDVLVTMDCDGQHEPSRIPLLLEAIHDADVVSGSRYLRDFRQDNFAPQDRRRINATITAEINARYGFALTDTFCGFKAYTREALGKLAISEPGWGMPLELWVQAAHAKLRVKEVAVPRLYLDPNRAFGGVMDDAEQRLSYYRDVIAKAEARLAARPALPDVLAGCCLFSGCSGAGS